MRGSLNIQKEERKKVCVANPVFRLTKEGGSSQKQSSALIRRPEDGV